MSIDSIHALMPRLPFGELSFEDENKILGSSYRSYHFAHISFNKRALDQDTYLIVGRRGVGKSSLAHFFTFQDVIKHADCIDVDAPEIYQSALARLSELASNSNSIAIPQICLLWEGLIWNLIFNHFRTFSPVIQKACVLDDSTGTASHLIMLLLQHLLSLLTHDKNGSLADEAVTLFHSSAAIKARAEVMKIIETTPILIAIDTLEQYDAESEPLMRATAALIQSASRFNSQFARAGLHLKIFIPAEIFPHLCENYVSNFSKYVHDEIYMQWRPKDLLRLLCWRFHRYLETHSSPSLPRANVEWSKHESVYRYIWKPFFGDTIINAAGQEEKTFSYILRHSQSRPRQLVQICNAVAHDYVHEGLIKPIPPQHIIATVKEIETRLATEIINSYSNVYKNVGRIAEALVGAPITFQGNYLDQCAPKTATTWQPGTYSSYAFRRLVSELGIVGKVRDVNPKRSVMTADFEYFMEGRLPLMDNDSCVIHPMFFSKLNAKIVKHWTILPFPDNGEYESVLRGLA